LCISNPEKTEKDSLFIKMLCKYIAKALLIKNLKSITDYARFFNEMTGLQNRKSLIHYLDNFKPDSVYSIGVASADINNLKLANEKFGIDYGNELIKGVGNCFRKVFAKK
ncbi:MAG: GGDEF domain-containing protein, partial [Lachnospiraceae bacterium]|nr:GGDEF domain-containing protein [Lachnospiraceae bacterium]